jgi:hypothetical protein
MISIKRYNEMKSVFNYDSILLKLKSHGWGMGSMTSTNDFESNGEYFLNPQNDDEYADQFHIYLTDRYYHRLRGDFQVTDKLNNSSPVSFYNKLT